MKIEIKNENYKPKNIKPLIEYFQSLIQLPIFEFKGLMVEVDPTIDCKANDALIRWTDINEGFNDKLIINSLAEFKTYFKLVNA
jgi:hypothetical protein